MYQLLKNKLKDQRGLTLIELLAVIVILGIIAAIAIPAIGNVISHTREKATVAEGVQIINAAKLYCSSNDVTASTTLDNSKLGSLLDNVKDTGYTVHVTFVSSGKYTYTLSGHGSVALVGATTPSGAPEATEQQLLDYK
ncbi:prepilin-type N-terminal cleavage/methylation domain-containing protein [Neobacillus drentensis]|uniref:prepilin-type N-terminal cleavage/methylation domain-containing protein n=1 Tax=Neobacillus drentensis TaxID=220684 RepID=UPI002FFF6EB0